MSITNQISNLEWKIQQESLLLTYLYYYPCISQNIVYNYIYIQFVMKKVRISKKNPNRILKAIEARISPNKQIERINRSLRKSLHIEQLRNLHGYDNFQISHKDGVIHSHRYKPSEPGFQFDRRKESYSPRQVSFKSQERQKYEQYRYRRPRGLRDIVHRSTDKSPYLQRHIQNKSERKLIINNRNLTQIGRNANKQLKTVRFNSLQQKSESLEIRKTSDSEDVLKEAKKLMVAGESRKSMFILKSLLIKDPTNLSALNIAAINLYNIGDYDKAAQHLEHLLQLKKDYSLNAYLLLAKTFIKLNKDISYTLSKLDECSKIYPNSEQVYMEKGQIYLSMSCFKEALDCFKCAEKLAPRNIAIQQKIMNAFVSEKEYNKALQIIENINKIAPNISHKYLQIKSRLLCQLNRFEQIITLNQHTQTNDPTLLYYYGYALYKTNNFLKSYLILQTSLTDSDNSTKSIQLMLLILCIGNDFYEAYHLLERCQYLNVDRDQLKSQFHFIQGTVCLMKRNTFQGVQKLNIAKQHLKGKIDDFSVYVSGLINMFIGYGYFCLGNYDKSQAHYQLQIKNYPNVHFDGMEYNMKLNRGFLLYQVGKLEESFKIFEEIAMNDNKKLQPHLCLAIIYVNLYFKKKEQMGVENSSYLHRAKDIFKNTQSLVSKFNNNIGANFFYHKSVLHSYLTEWKDAIVHIDEALQKSQENYWRYYYVRALIMACIHNFQEAINDCTAAINLKSTEPAPYFLRSSCFQIQGQGNYAFKDLQSYISLRPNDKDIHKFAGKLLFENGAFEDALAAFNHQPIPQTLQNQDAYLTKSKTFFLLGRFLQAGEEMFRVFKINQSRKQTLFDGQMMMVLDKLLDMDKDYNQIIDDINNLYQQKGLTFVKNQVFKKTQHHTLKSICYFYTQRYKQAIAQLEKAMVVKQKTILKQSLMQGSTREDEKDTNLYLSQMNFNISLCYVMMGQRQIAKEYADKMHFSSNDVFYEPHQRYISVLRKNKILVGHEDEVVKIEIFPSRNKISNFLKEVSVKLDNQQVLYVKLCIPFPKVQPPQIFPTFDEKLLKQFTIQKIQRKSQAPWICKQQNTVKFTSKMQKYSRLEIEQSSTEKSVTENDFQIDNSHMSVDSIVSRRSKISAPKIYDTVGGRKSDNRKKVYF